MAIKSYYQYILLIVAAYVFNSCGPAIKSFTADPVTVTSKDSVQLHWKVRGTPTLLYFEDPVTDSLLPHYLHFNLVVNKGGKELARPLTVIVLPKKSGNIILFNTVLHGDTLIAKGTKNPERWGTNFEIMSVATGCKRKLTVTHAGITVDVDEDGTFSNLFAATPVEGDWEFRSMMTDAEKMDHTIAPGALRIQINIQRKIR